MPSDDKVTLNTNDPFEAAIGKMVLTARAKGADYASDTDPWSNFRGTAGYFGFKIWDAAIFNVVQKLQRLRALRMNDRVPINESTDDTYLDLAVYATLAYAMYREEYERKLVNDKKS